jgi:hypothetical protein
MLLLSQINDNHPTDTLFWCSVRHFMLLDTRQYFPANSRALSAFGTRSCDATTTCAFSSILVNWKPFSTLSSVPLPSQVKDLKSNLIFPVNVTKVVIKQVVAAATKRSSGDTIPSGPPNSGGVAKVISGLLSIMNLPVLPWVQLTFTLYSCVSLLILIHLAFLLRATRKKSSE